ncbi:MAG: hypothetical protein HOM11_04955 [Methylococcales bacterium]|jgi:hypothetical protein|nr:hypothetical protein [Methylococcales bacterium]MBT7443496.1 hypothetical protein [Methylococcales bacterium]
MSEFKVETWYQGLLKQFSMFTPPSTISSLLGNEVGAKTWAKLLAFSKPMPAHDKLIHGIHSELTDFERKFTYGFFSEVWSGQKNVLEIGSFLGSSSRAMCLGMLMNQKRVPGVKLYTYDKFDTYYTNDEQFNFLQGQVPESALNTFRETGSFKECFDYYHSGQEYSHLLEADYGVLPGKPEDVGSLQNCFKLEEGIEFDAVFVDGAKSWYGTKYFFQTIAAHVKPGAFIIFQDYGHYPCFWLSTFVALLKHNFRLAMNIDNTYTFELIAPLDAEEIDVNFPDHPRDLAPDIYEQIYIQEMREANVRSDTYAFLSLSLQYAAALAYIGQIDEAKMKILRLAAQPYFADYMGMIQQALKTPTYSPDGAVQIP